MAKKGWKTCQENGYHDWGVKGHIDSTSESLDEIELVAECGVCGATGEGTIYWENEEDE